MAAHAREIDDAYARDKQRYTGLEKHVRARHILVKVASDASEVDKAVAREKAQELWERARKGEDFAALARQYSEDEGSKKKGGDLGFNPKGRMVAPFDEAQFSLAPGAISDVVETTYGFHVIKVEGVREGDVPPAEAKREIAEKLYRERVAAGRAEREARELHAKLLAGMPVEEAEAQLRAGDLPAAGAEGAEAEAPPAAAGADAEPAPEVEATAEPDPLAPTFRETAPFGRTDTPIPGPFDASALVTVAFELTEEKPVPPEPMKLGDDWFVVRLEKRERAFREAFTDDEKARLREVLLERRRQDVFVEYVHALRRAAEEAGEIRPDPKLIASAAPPASAPAAP
jgi:peptidyl-prolyl cis-trans isomerase D